jgi:hypothetical protein
MPHFEEARWCPDVASRFSPAGWTVVPDSSAIELARRLGLQRIPHPSSGCALANVEFAEKVFDLIHWIQCRI